MTAAPAPGAAPAASAGPAPERTATRIPASAATRTPAAPSNAGGSTGSALPAAAVERDGDPVWGGLAGQSQAIEELRAAASDGGSLAHSWLITGPPGSGRSNLAFAFATALIAGGTPESARTTRTQIDARTHPDLAVLSTERVIITIDEVRTLVKSSQFSPSVGRHRVMVIEDADRMTERTSNLLLKALEEPPERTIWVLCAPSEADLIPTIRSRVRSVRLRVPSVADVALLIEQRDGVDPIAAERAARQAQSHIGMAHRLATNEEARDRRDETLRIAIEARSVADAVLGAARLLEIAGADAKAITEERDAEERADALRSLGVAPGAAPPPALRGQIRALEEDQKRRATRSLRDGIDRILVDLLSLYRDVLVVQLGAGGELVNRERSAEIDGMVARTRPAATLSALDAIAEARVRIGGNVSPALALEAMLAALIRKDV